MAQLQSVSIVDAEESPDREAELIARYIKPHPDDRGRAYAYFPDYGHSVSAIVRALGQPDGEIGRTATDWDMPEEAVRAAIAFYRRYREYIDARILLEDDWFDGDFRSR